MFNIDKIEELIPHRYPFLLIDKITEFEKQKEIKGIKNVSVNEPYFQGHFPKFPIMPGVLIVESMAQLAAALVVLSLGKEKEDYIPFFTGVKRAKFRKPVFPGDQMFLNVTVLQTRGANWRFKGEARVNNMVTTEAEFQAMFQEK